MQVTLKRFSALLLALVLFLGMAPHAFAAEMEQTTDPTVETPAVETTQATEETAPLSTEESISVLEDTPALMSADDPYGIMTAASTQSGILLFDYADNGNYTSSLNSQITVGYKWNGTGSTLTCFLKNFGWHFARINNVPYADDPLYCIEPHRDYAASTSGNSVDRGVTLTGSGSTTGSSVWYSLDADRREAIGLILLYSNEMWDHSISVTTTSKANNPNVPLRMATQFLIFEIICGLRDAETFELKSSNECGYSGDIFYNAGTDAISYFAPNYNQLVSHVQAALEIPSFTSASSSSAPTIELDGEETSVYDSNGVLGNFSFTDGNGAEFYKSGNTLYITQTGDISESTVFKATRSIPSAANSTYNIYYMSGSTYQTTISLYSPSTGSLNAYFKLKAAPVTGDLSLVKTTEDGNNLSGWQFGIYTNSACTTLAAGPYTTNSSGKISVTGLSAGTYYVKELGHTDSSINALYTCTSTNPQKVTISSGSTASVSFYNQLNPSGLSLTKTTEDGKNLSGWQFGIYADSGCSTLVSGPHTTDSSGKISVTGLSAGTVYVKELGHTDSSIHALYSCSSTNPQAVTLTAGQTATVSFHNTLNKGGVKLVKQTNTGENLGGWQIGLYYDADCTNAVTGSPFTTAQDGTVSVTDLQPGTLYAKEIPTDDPYWEFDTAVKTVTIASGQTATVTFSNTHYGRIEFRKTTNTGNHLDGWTFRVRDADGNIIGDYTTDENGYACTENLPLGRYTVVELPTEDTYWNCPLGFHDVTVQAGETVVDEWLNREQGLGWFHKATNTGENLEGWEITIYSDAACTQEVSSVTTNEDGKVGLYLDPGVYYAKETGDENGRFEDEYWLVDETIREFEIKAHADTEIYFTNTHYGNILIRKAMPDGGSVSDWTFDVYRKSDNTHIGTYTSGEDGSILSDFAEPGEYLIYEKIPEDSLYVCDAENPQTVTIAAGKTAEVTFTNRLKLGEISILKVNHKGEPLAGATFLLEWSEDGSTWEPVTYTEEKGAINGTCTSPNLSNGCLTSGEDGIVSFTGLHPQRLYRLTETKSPEGYLLLTDAAYEGGIETDKGLTVTLTVVNSPVYELPMTGSAGSLLLECSQIFCILMCGAMLAYPLVFRKKAK